MQELQLKAINKEHSERENTLEQMNENDNS